MSLRTFRRRLKAEGTTYKEILTQIRMQLENSSKAGTSMAAATASAPQPAQQPT